MFTSRTNWPLEPNLFTQALAEHRRNGKELWDLTVSNPTECGFQYPEQEILAALADKRSLEYHPESKGLREARQAAARYYDGRSGFGGPPKPVDPEYILLTSGTSEAYTHIFRLLCEAGDEVLIPAPSYPLFEFLADLADIRLVPYPLLYDHGWQIDFVSLRALLTPRSRAVLVVHPNNPTGSFVKAREAAELAEICSAREMAIVADEVFLDYAGDYTNGPEQARTFALQDTALTFTLSGLSKISLLPQMKLAWTIVSGPEALVQTAVERLEIIADTYLSPGTPVQLALPKFLALRHGMQAQLRQRISANLAALDVALRESKLLGRLDHEGGWYAIVRVPVTGTDEALAVSLIERFSVLVHPGHFFNFSRDGFLVLSLIAQKRQFQEGVRRVRRCFDE